MQRQEKIKAAIAGGAGYTGGEALRLLLNHPGVEVLTVQSRTYAGKRVSEIHTDLVGDTDLLFSEGGLEGADVLFLCLGHGEAKKYLAENSIDINTRVIDLSQDHRLQPESVHGHMNFVYGLPEHKREDIKMARYIANPGCFATAIQLGLLPLAAAGLLRDVYTTGITGSTGAGQQLQATSHFSRRAANIEAYKTLNHQHLHEIKQTLVALQPDFTDLDFIPWRGDFTRGIYTSSCMASNLTLTEAEQLYIDYYRDHPFTHVSRTMINLKQVVNTNKCLIHIEQNGKKLVIHTAIDNLLKGASGQALQNMNLMFGLPEQEGLRLKATSF